MTTETDVDVNVLIVGAGIVGLATAYNLTGRYPDLRVVVVEKEAAPAQHQTGHNSGVLHSGIYYKPGSLKATQSLAGRTEMLRFCEQEGIPVDICGKVIVAVDESDDQRLESLIERGRANGIHCEVIGPERLHEIEPHAAGRRAIHLPGSAVVDFRVVCDRLAQRILERGGRITTSAQVTGLRERETDVAVRTTAGDFVARYLVNCGGLHSDRLAHLAADRPSNAAPVQIVPFRGEYYRLGPQAQHLVNHLIYPVPDPAFPFLGVHFTRTAWGEVECGPNAVLAFAREGYRKTDVNVRDLVETLAYPGFRRMAARYWRMGLGEMQRSFSKAAFVRALQRMMPAIRAEDLEPMPAGVRAQAVAPDGAMLDDFAFAETPRMVHVINAPSPAATASLSIGRSVVDKLAARF